jgi:hypothetical protein
MNKQHVAALIAAVCTASVALDSEARKGSTVVMTNASMTSSSFCTDTGNITVVHNVTHDAHGQVSFGVTALSGPTTYRFGPGNHAIAKGCYSHSIANTTVVGNAQAKSTIWYD